MPGVSMRFTQENIQRSVGVVRDYELQRTTGLLGLSGRMSKSHTYLVEREKMVPKERQVVPREREVIEYESRGL